MIQLGMESFWKGAFLQKHIGSVTYVPLSRMSKEDWKVLDYGALRPAARRLLQEAVMAGQMRGFFRVKYDMHKSETHGGKPEYYYPATADKVEAFENDELSDTEFQNFGVSTPYRDGSMDNYAADAKQVPQFTRTYDELTGLTTLTLATMLAIVVAAVDDEEVEPEVFEDWGVEYESIALMAYIFRASLAELREIARELEVDSTGLSEEALRKKLFAYLTGL
jgi:hypothetical protein